jgi:hypothetical protein
MRGSVHAWADRQQFGRVELKGSVRGVKQSHKIAMMRFGILNKAFSISIVVLSGFVMLCQVFSAFWSMTIGRK